MYIYNIYSFFIKDISFLIYKKNILIKLHILNIECYIYIHIYERYFYIIKWFGKKLKINRLYYKYGILIIEFIIL